nr:QWRF motif-containing protein 7 [Ipomoea batatas]
MESYNRSRKQPAPVIPRSPAASPRLLRSRSGGTSSTATPPPYSSETGSKFVGRSNSSTILRSYENNVSAIAQKQNKKSQKDNHRSSMKSSMSPSAWALSPGRSLPSSPAMAVPNSPRSKGFKMDASAVSGVLKYFKQKKVSPVQQEEYHQFRIMHNRLLQWRFANARAMASIPNIKSAAQNKLFNVWLRIWTMRKFMAEKRIKIQQLKHEIKLNRIFNSQGGLLKDWAKLEAKNSEAVGRVARKLSAISICLPLVDEAQADVVSVKDAIVKAEGMVGNIEELIMKMQWQVEQSCCLLTQLIPILKQEKVYFEELHNKITAVISNEVEEESLRVHHIQQIWELRRAITPPLPPPLSPLPAANFLLGLASCNIDTTSRIEGRSAGFRLVHSNAILSNNIISSRTRGQDAPAFLSNTSVTPSLTFNLDLTQSTMLLPSPNSESIDLFPVKTSINTTP